MRRLACITAAGALVALCVPPAAATAQSPVAIARLGHPPRLDGTLDDPTWQQATLFDSFVMLHPDAGKATTVRTEVRLAYDRTNLYAAIRALDQDSGALHATATDTSGIGHDDRVAFCLDSRADGIGAFYFVVTPRGVRGTGVLNFDGDPTAGRDLRWTSAARMDAHGYTVTMAIPLAQLPYPRNDSAVMTFKVARLLAGGEEDDFPEIRTDRPHIAQLQPILLTDIRRSDRGAHYDDGFVADLRAAYRRKLAEGRRYDFGTLEGRTHGWHGASVMDYLVFPSRPLRPSATPFRLPTGSREAAESVTAQLERLEYLPGHPIAHLYRFLTRTETQAFIVVHDDTVIYERYFNGFGRDSMLTSFSVAKSFVSTLVGLAVANGRIHAVTDPITRYLPELERRDTLFRRITIADLMHMASGLRYIEDSPPYDNDVTYLDPFMRRAALEKTEIIGPPRTSWHYNNYNPLLLGMILERATGKSVSALLQDGLWTPLGMEYGGSWSLDSRADSGGFEKMESGINARAIDFAKFGALFVDHGRWRGEQVLPEAWVAAATQPEQEPPGFYDDPFWTDHYYGWFWWGSRRAGGESDFYGVGNKGEYVYCSPQKHLVVVRMGFGFGISSDAWVGLFRRFADKFPQP